MQPREDGLFLVRESTNFPGDYTLCVCFQGKVEHYRVKYLENKLTIDDEEYFENLGQLVAVSFSKYTTSKKQVNRKSYYSIPSTMKQMLMVYVPS